MLLAVDMSRVKSNEQGSDSSLNLKSCLVRDKVYRNNDDENNISCVCKNAQILVITVLMFYDGILEVRSLVILLSCCIQTFYRYSDINLLAAHLRECKIYSGSDKTNEQQCLYGTKFYTQVTHEPGKRNYRQNLIPACHLAKSNISI